MENLVLRLPEYEVFLFLSSPINILPKISFPGLLRKEWDGAAKIVEWREGVSPSRSPRTGRDSLPSSSSYCPALA